MKDIEYARPEGKPQRLDLYFPEKADRPLPLIIWIHGGGWLEGGKGLEGVKGGDHPVVGQLQRGYAVASIEYRLSPEAKWPAQIFDCKAAVRFLRANAKRYNLDPGRFGVWGDSAGGHLAAMVGVSGGVKELEGDLGNPGVSSSVQAVCDWYGPTDLTVIQKTPNNAVGPVSQLIGGPIAENLEKARTASPINYVTRNTPAFLIMHGDQDETVPINQSELLNEALQKAGAWVKFVRVQGAKHGGPDFAGFNNPTILTMIEQFFDEHLQAPG